MQAGARRLALTIARALQLTLLCEHAQWMLDHGKDRRGYAAALRFSRLPVDMMHEVDPEPTGCCSVISSRPLGRAVGTPPCIRLRAGHTSPTVYYDSASSFAAQMKSFSETRRPNASRTPRRQ